MDSTTELLTARISTATATPARDSIDLGAVIRGLYDQSDGLLVEDGRRVTREAALLLVEESEILVERDEHPEYDAVIYTAVGRRGPAFWALTAGCEDFGWDSGGGMLTIHATLEEAVESLEEGDRKFLLGEEVHIHNPYPSA